MLQKAHQELAVPSHGCLPGGWRDLTPSPSRPLRARCDHPSGLCGDICTQPPPASRRTRPRYSAAPRDPSSHFAPVASAPAVRLHATQSSRQRPDPTRQSCVCDVRVAARALAAAVVFGAGGSWGAPRRCVVSSAGAPASLSGGGRKSAVRGLFRRYSSCTPRLRVASRSPAECSPEVV